MVATNTHAETQLALQAQHILAAHSIALALQTGDTPFSSPPDCLIMVGPSAHHLETQIEMSPSAHHLPVMSPSAHHLPGMSPSAHHLILVAPVCLLFPILAFIVVLVMQIPGHGNTYLWYAG
jgi:hypothetical protein